MLIQRVHHLAVVVHDVAASTDFYCKVFGFEQIPRLTASLSKNNGAWFRVGELELHLQGRGEKVEKTDQHFALLTEDLDEVVLRIKKNGGRSEPAKLIEGFSKREFVYDPDDNRIELLQK